MNEELIAAVASGRVIVFVGAGVSATLGVPTWKELIAHMAQELGFEARVLAPPGVNYLTLAEFFRVQLGEEGIEALCTKMREEWNAKPDALASSKIYRAIYDLKFSIVYTTNYDHNIENAFREFGGSPLVVTHVDSFPAWPSASQIVVKFHGDLDHPRTVVLTERDYFERLNFESPIDIRLRSDALSYSLLFLGYSLSDINIRLLLYKLTQMWRNASGARRPRSFLLLQRPNEMERAVLDSWGVEVLTHDVDDPKVMLGDFLEKLREAVTGRNVAAA